MKQILNTALIPESGLLLEPPFVAETLVEGDFIRALSHLVGRSPTGSVMLRCNSGGDLRVAIAGNGYEVYEVQAGAGAAAYAAGTTYLFAIPMLTVDVLIETFAAQISFLNAAGVWGGDKSLPVGFYSIDFVHYGFRIRNRVALNNCAFEATFYR